MKRQSNILFRWTLFSMIITLVACGETPPAQSPNAVSNPVSVQKVQLVASAESKETAKTGEAMANPLASAAPDAEIATLPKPEPEQTVFEPEAKSTPIETKVEKSVSPAEVEIVVGLSSAEEPISAKSTRLEAEPAKVIESSTVQVATAIGAADEPSDVIKESLQVAGLYNPQDRFDPFEPLFKAQSADLPVTTKSTKEKRAPQTPLERVALSQLKVTAIIRSATGNRALVEDATGKGYVVQRGTYIGLNAGRVTEIDKGRIVVEEEIENIMGGLTLQNAEIKLQKPAGEL